MKEIERRMKAFVDVCNEHGIEIHVHCNKETGDITCRIRKTGRNCTVYSHILEPEAVIIGRIVESVKKLIMEPFFEALEEC